MKYFLLIVLSILSANCSSRKDGVDPDLYLTLNKNHSQKHAVCKEQEKKILAPAITETQDAELDDENFFFVRNETKALEFIKQLEISKFTLVENQLETQALINACVTKKDKAYKPCDTHQSAMKYFRGLVYALRQYNWSGPTQKIAVNQILSYLNYVGGSKASLMDLFYANDLLMRVINLNIVPKENYQETVSFRHEIENAYDSLRQMIVKLSKKKLRCEDAQKIYQEERKLVIDLSDKFLVMMRKI